MTDISNNIALKSNVGDGIANTGYELGGKMYLFHQTPPLLGKDLMQFVPLVAGDSCYEPFAGEGAFYNAFPSFVSSDWSEITRGRDYKDYKGSYDWVISNPPFKVPNKKGVLKNAIYPLLLEFAKTAKKGIAFLVSDYGFNSLTPVRIAKMASLGFFLQSLTTCAVKKWRGRYYFLIWMKEPSNFLTCLQGTY
jgi:hypothetical protein